MDVLLGNTQTGGHIFNKIEATGDQTCDQTRAITRFGCYRRYLGFLFSYILEFLGGSVAEDSTERQVFVLYHFVRMTFQLPL